jgi:hypothetical protein
VHVGERIAERGGIAPQSLIQKNGQQRVAELQNYRRSTYAKEFAQDVDTRLRSWIASELQGVLGDSS